MTEEEYEAFKEGKSIVPQSIYEQFGMQVVSAKRFYGDENQEKER